ncbi:MAG: hypothetical protein ACXWSC_02090 [Bdellovibrionota bacterium]
MKLAAALSLFLCLTAVADNSPDDNQPNPGEAFPTYFARITRGGTFSGIYLEMPKALQPAFLHRIRKGAWVGDRDKIERQLSAAGVDLWGNWYKETTPQKLIFPDPASRAIFTEELGRQITQDHSQCGARCPTPESVMNQPWENQDAFSHQEFTKTFVYRAPLFHGRTLLDFLGDLYHFPAATVAANTRVSMMDHAGFVKAVHELGYDGQVYFRGITSPDPADPTRHVILLDDEMLAKGSPFPNALFRCLEISGILTHESSHVFQDLKGRELGLDIEVTSPETALVVEGMAETLAEKAMRAAGETAAVPSALSLFAAAQGEEIVYRPGNETSGALFPYTVGLPFAWSLFDSAPPERVTLGLLSVLGGKISLKTFLDQLAAP